MAMVIAASKPVHSRFTPVPILLQAEQDRFQHDILVYLIGCGGNGGWLAPHLARRAWQLNRMWQRLNGEQPAGRYNRSIKLVFVDPDIVELKNVEARQNFILCDVGFPKARVLATRYTLAHHGLQIEARMEPFNPAWVSQFQTSVLIDCVDNARARQSINAALSRNVGATWPSVWWLSAGNGRSSGQILLGNTSTVARLAGALEGVVCGRVPSPALLEPGLLIPQPDEEDGSDQNLSCEELALADLQSPTINPHMAVWLDYYLHSLLFGGLTLCATYVSLDVGGVSSLETSAQAWAERFHKDPAFFLEIATEPDPTSQEEE
jgi:ThiF family